VGRRRHRLPCAVEVRALFSALRKRIGPTEATHFHEENNAEKDASGSAIKASPYSLCSVPRTWRCTDATTPYPKMARSTSTSW